MDKNAILSESGLVGRIARKAVAEREAEYAGEIRRLLDAALDQVRRGGPHARPRVADIVAAAGLSNDAFYRHFRSKDALMAAVLADGVERLADYVAHRMSKQARPERRVRSWVAAILAQAEPASAADTRAVLCQTGALGVDLVSGQAGSAPQRLAALLYEPFGQLGVREPEHCAGLVAYAVVGKLSEYLWSNVEPASEEVERLAGFCLSVAAVEAGAGSGALPPRPIR
ncbi:TetR/AcrR family transcriptional regulator [Nocardia speluncae]|uniref:TetR/AcrR family transcriptional regulator n=1 Tax=Nocardia speluncae TaxID=419477 RepID=UPI001FDEE246|nr:TetR/AcrR family transcriptional regulator [Nocardia speluncae]